MKRLIKKAIKFLVTPALLLNRLVMRTNWYKNVIPKLNNYPTNNWYREHDERNYDVVNVGSSSGVYAFDYKDIDVKAFNWAMQPQSMEYSFKILKNFFSILDEHKGIILIPFSPFSGLSVSGKWTESTYEKYYYLLDSNLIDNYNRITKIRQYPLFYRPKESLKRLIKDVPQKSGMMNCNICQTKEEYEQDALIWIKIWKTEFDINDLDLHMSQENVDGSKERCKTVQNMISFCLERGLHPVLIIPPIHPALLTKLTPAFRENYIYKFIRKANTAGVPFMDYIDVPEFKDDKYFANSYFMSQEGAKKFTKMVLKELKVI